VRAIRVVFPLLTVLSTLVVAAEDWPRFRGPNGSGVSSSTGLPVEFGPDKNKVWEVEVPFGRSSPVIAGDRVFLSATEDGKLVTLAIDRGSGKTLWRSVLERAGKAEFHHDTDSSTPTPVTDGSNVYVFFHEFGLVAYDATGKERWKLPLGPFRNFYSIAASPLLAGNTLIMLCDQAQGSFIVGVNKDTGRETWRSNRPARLESYSTPALYPEKGEPQAVLVAGARWVDAYDPATGKSLWSVGDVGTGPVSSPVVAGDTLFINAPNHAESGWSPFDEVAKEFDKDASGGISRDEAAGGWVIEHFGWLDVDADGTITVKDWNALGQEMTNENWGVYAIRLPAAGGKAEKLWNYRKNVPEIASPLVHGGVFYMIHDGVLTSLDAKTGELIKRDRIVEGSPKVYASPVLADGKIYLGTLEGKLVVVKAGGEWSTLATVDLGDEIWASPAVVDGNLYVRTRGKLYRFGVR